MTLKDGRVVDRRSSFFATGYRTPSTSSDQDIPVPTRRECPAALAPAPRTARPSPLSVCSNRTPTSGLRALAKCPGGGWLRALEAPGPAGRFWDRHGPGSPALLPRPGADSPRHWFEVNHLMYLRALEQAINELEAVR